MKTLTEYDLQTLEALRSMADDLRSIARNVLHVRRGIEELQKAGVLQTLGGEKAVLEKMIEEV
jgi:hypothetical protein